MEDQRVNNFFVELNCLKTGATADKAKFKLCQRHFDKDEDGMLNRAEFHNLLAQLFCQNGQHIDQQIEERIFSILDDDCDGKLNDTELYLGWRYWMKQVLDPVTALIVVDVQNDFIDGSLALKNCPSLHHGGEVLPVINALLESVPFDVVVYTKDWHPGNHVSFVDNVKMRPLHYTSCILADCAKTFDEVVFSCGEDCMPQKLWPVHCVQNTHGAELHKGLRIRHDGLVVLKGTNPDIDSYSAFWDNGKKSQTNLVSLLKERHVTDVYVCGLAYDVCVAYTAFDAIEHGYRTVLIDDACRGVDEACIEKTRLDLKSRGAVVADSKEVRDMVVAVDRRLELGYVAALNLELAKSLVKEMQAT